MKWHGDLIGKTEELEELSKIFHSPEFLKKMKDLGAVLD
jgi:hypothetical protein